MLVSALEQEHAVVGPCRQGSLGSLSSSEFSQSVSPFFVEYFAHVCWSYTSDLNAQHGITGFQERTDATGAPSMILPETPAEQAFNAAHNSNNCQQQPCGARWALWPSSVVVDPASGHALVFYMLVSALPGNFNFQAIGNSVATWQSLQGQPQRPTINPPVVAGHPDLLFNENEPSFGSAALISGGMLYVYGCGLPTSGTDKGCRLGRVNPASVLDRSAWSYYAGNGNWSSMIGNAVSVFTGDNILSVAWNNYLGQYLAVYSAPFFAKRDDAHVAQS